MTESIDFDQSSAHSLNCGSDFKDIHCNQLQSIAKLSRSDLEDLYYQLHDENIDVKRKFNNLDSKYKVMATRVMRLSRDHKCIDTIDREDDQRQLKQLKQNEAALRSKLTVLRGQLASHTRLHSAALSKTQRPRSHRCSRSCHAEHSTCGRAEDIFSDIGHSANQSRSQSRHRSTSCSNNSNQREVRETVLQKPQNEVSKINTALREEVAFLKERISTLQKEMTTSSEQSHKRIIELERELGKHLERETAENVELIKARRLIKQHEGAMISLQQEHQLVLRELQACKSALNHAARDQDEMCSTLMQERQRSTDLQQEIVKLTQTCSSMREIQEQLNDTQKENAVLKEHSNRLLQLTTGAVDFGPSPRGDQVEVKEHTKSQVSLEEESAILEENSVIEKRLESLKLLQSHLQQEVNSTQAEVSNLQSMVRISEKERNALKEEHMKIKNECLKLHEELSEPKKELTQLTLQLSEVRSECIRLEEELSKSKSDLDHQLQEQQDLHRRSQELKANAEPQENSSGMYRGSPLLQHGNASPVLPLSSRPVFHTPQLSARASHFLIPTHPHSHPSTPRPRVGDACLALLEQTAIRQPSTPFPGVMGSHCSLQERFLELCIPATSVSSSSTPVPPLSVHGGESTKERTSQQAPNASIDNLVKPRLGQQNQIPVGVGDSDTQWELNKCRELLRVQFNLNSIYKKEVASLSNIVQSLTSGTQDSSK